MNKLKVGMPILHVDGSVGIVSNIKVVPGPQVMYNLTVAEAIGLMMQITSNPYFDWNLLRLLNLFGGEMSSNNITYLTRDTVISINKLIIYKKAKRVIRDEEMLESAITAPKNAAYYTGADLILQTATLIERLALNHPFLDGNKRTALIAGSTFLLINGFQIFFPNEVEEAMYGKEVELLVSRRDFQHLGGWLKGHVLPWKKDSTDIEEAIQISLHRFDKDLEYLKDR